MRCSKCKTIAKDGEHGPEIACSCPNAVLESEMEPESPVIHRGVFVQDENGSMKPVDVGNQYVPPEKPPRNIEELLAYTWPILRPLLLQVQQMHQHGPQRLPVVPAKGTGNPNTVIGTCPACELAENMTITDEMKQNSAGRTSIPFHCKCSRCQTEYELRVAMTLFDVVA